ncbi:hypothetical protein [Vibrio campbellii]|uniref:hypothetical protein n=1 Tax=Vibrio campbellii TaxID=680 RepID=UPI00210AF2EE|nr:hypothetical protein [Vibrio campbellii]UTZ44521.1 hypothetical protein HB764_25000 [Vibrio campbellii]
MAKTPTESWNGLMGYNAVAKHFGVSVKTVYYYRRKCQGTLADAAELLVERQSRINSEPRELNKKPNVSALWALALGHSKENG